MSHQGAKRHYIAEHVHTTLPARHCAPHPEYEYEDENTHVKFIYF